MSDKNGFTLLVEKEIPEIKTRVRFYRHDRTGAELLSMVNEDENKVFGVTFRTPPEDSTGLPHIMEHAVLCGSEKYPVKEPFVELLKGSLNTFLNAFTFPDKTCYPVASQNASDFYNLVDVYLDAVFHPLIPAHTLKQEGWHYELDALDSPLSYKGVVFNEMKGAYSNPDDLLQDNVRMSLYPDTPYVRDYGGDPRHIPSLTYEQFKAFHKKFYHPTNARFFFYGDDDPERRLEILESCLRSYQKIEIDSSPPLQARFQKPRRRVVPFDPGETPEAQKGMLTVNWLLPEALDPRETLELGILAYILIGTSASPLRKALIDSGMGEDLAGVGFEGDLRQMFFSIGLKGMAVDENLALKDEEALQNLIWDTLGKLANEGIDRDTVAASLNTVEFSLRENNTGSFPRGISLMLRALSGWLYDRDPIAPLAFEAPLSAIKKQISAGENLFETLIKRHFLENDHRTIVIMQPETGLVAKMDQEEAERLDQIRASLSDNELQAILEGALELKRIQEKPDSPEALAAIPVLKLSDLERQNKIIPSEISEQAGSKLIFHDLFTNGILYLDLGFDLHALPVEYLPFVSLFSRSLLEIGTDKEDFVKLSQRIGRSTGGISPASFISTIRNTTHSAAWLYLRGKSTVAQAGELLEILKDILLTVKLDNRERFQQMLMEEKAGLEAGLIPSGHRVVNLRLRSAFAEADWAQELMGGIEYLFFIRQLVQVVEQDWQSVLEKLEGIRQLLVNRDAMICNITLDAQNWHELRSGIEGFLGGLPSFSPQFHRWQPAAAEAYEGLAVPSPVNYVGKGANLFELGYQADGSVDVINNYLSTTWLWEKVRVQGGAYGGFCQFNSRSGVYCYLSYRDPNLAGTLDNYDGTSEFLRHLELHPDELTKSIIGAIGDLDAYQLPDAKGYSAMARYLVGDTLESRQQWREQILSTSAEDFHHFGEVLEKLNQSGRVVAMGASDTIEKARVQYPGWKLVRKII
ncbi:MAG: peptidase M16 [Chloroflexi bacterium RBG_16_54_18]|nr:MAG: peptidase M16 [Chloroflexi bacterium RBG_16_54_18]